MSMRAGGTPRPGRGSAGSAITDRVNLARTTNADLSATPQNVVWDTVNWQSGFAVNAGDSAIVVPTTGYYQVNFNLMVAVGGENDFNSVFPFEATIRVNAAVVLDAPHNSVCLLAPGGAAWAVGQGSQILLPCVGVMSLTAGDSLTATILQFPTQGGLAPVILGVAAVSGTPGTTLSIQRVG